MRYVPRKNPLARLWSQIEITPTCWRWVGAINGQGYGAVRWDGKMRGAHRVVYELLVGPIPDKLQLDHTCHKAEDKDCPGGSACQHRRCVNPDHLKPTTIKVNVLRGKGVTAKLAKKKHCQQDHPLSGFDSRGQRICKICRAVATAAYQERIAGGQVVSHVQRTKCGKGHQLSKPGPCPQCRKDSRLASYYRNK